MAPELPGIPAITMESSLSPPDARSRTELARTLHSRTFQAGAALALAVVLLGLGYLGVKIVSPAPVAPAEKLSLAMPTVPHAALLLIAAAKGYFTEEGLDLTILPVTDGKAALELVVERKADVAAVADLPFVLAVMKGEALGIAASMLRVSNDKAIVARRDRGIAEPRDLPGKTIGVTFGTSKEYFLWSYLIWRNLTPESVTQVNLSPAEIPQALVDGTIDAAATWNPTVLIGQAILGENAVSFTDHQAYRLSFLLVGQQHYLKMHPKAIEKFVRAMLRAEQFNDSRPEEATSLMAGLLKADVKAFRPGWRHFDPRVDLQQSLLVTLEDQARWAISRGHAAGGSVPNFLASLYLDALLGVKPERVTVVR